MKNLFDMKIYRLHSFTLLEAVVSMFLMAMVISIGYYAYTVTIKMYQLQMKKNQRYMELAICNYVISRDFYTAQYIQQQAPYSFELYKNGQVISNINIIDNAIIYEHRDIKDTLVKDIRCEKFDVKKIDNNVTKLSFIIKDTLGYYIPFVFTHENSNADNINMVIDKME